MENENLKVSDHHKHAILYALIPHSVQYTVDYV